MNNSNFEIFSEELKRIKKTAPQDGEAKYFEHTLKRRVGFFIRKEIAEVKEREIIEVGEYITFKEFLRILHDFLEDFNMELKRISRYMCDKLNIDKLSIFVDNYDNLILKYNDRYGKKVRICFDLNNSLSRLLEQNNIIVSDHYLRKKLLSLIDTFRYYREFLKYTKRKICIGEFTSIEIKNINGDFDISNPFLCLNFKDLANYIVSFYPYNKTNAIFMEHFVFSSNIEIKMYLLKNIAKLENEIFIKKDDVKYIMKVAKNYNTLLYSNAVKIGE